MTYFPRTSLILPGDILLTRNIEASGLRDRLLSGLIASVTRGAYSHAMICLQTPTFIEAIDAGVGTLSVLNGFAHALKNVRLLRYADADIAAAAAGHAAFFLGKDYSTQKAMLSVLPGRVSASLPAEETFCSALVAEAFRMADAPEFRGIDPLKVTPATLQKMPCLQDLTQDVFLPRLSPRNIEGMTALDGDRIRTPGIGQAGILKAYFEGMKDLTEVEAFERAGIAKPRNFFAWIAGIAKVMVLRTQEFETLPRVLQDQVLAADARAFELLNDNRWRGLVIEMTRLDDISMAELIRQSFLPNPDFSLSNLEDTRLTTLEQIEERSRAAEPYAKRRLGFCRSLDYYLDLNELALVCLRRRKAVLTEVQERIGLELGRFF